MVSSHCISWPGADEKVVVEEMLRDSQSSHWQECSVVIRRFIQKQVQNVSQDQQDDLAQEIIIRVYKSLSAFQYKCTLGTWRFSIMRNCIFDAYRKLTRTRQLMTLPEDRSKFVLPDADTLLTPEYDLCSEMTWFALYPMLRAQASRYVCHSHIPAWQEQEEDIVEDIVQETTRRLIERTRRIEQGLAAPICSLFHFIATTIRNYYVDLRRRDLRPVLEIAALDDAPVPQEHEIDKTGQGKSALLAKLVLQILNRGLPFVFIDPLKNLARNILKMLEWEREKENRAQKPVQGREMSGTLPPSQGIRDKFLWEAQLPETLRHAHILPIYEFGINDSLPYLVTQHTSGSSPRGLFIGRPPHHLQLGKAISDISQMVSALDYVHQQNIVYHDLKPENILVSERAVWIEVGLEQKPDAVLTSAHLLLHLPDQLGYDLPSETSILQVYAEAQKELLILGKPGAGKSALLLSLAQQLVEQALDDATPPLSVILPLSPWMIKRQPFQDWVSKQIAEIYHVPHQVCEQFRGEVSRKSDQSSTNLDLATTHPGITIPSLIDRSPAYAQRQAAVSQSETEEQAYTTLLKQLADRLVETHLPTKGSPTPLIFLIDCRNLVDAVVPLETIKRRLPLHRLVIVTSLSAQDMYEKTVQTGIADMKRLQAEEFIESLIVTDPHSPFTTHYLLGCVIYELAIRQRPLPTPNLEGGDSKHFLGPSMWMFIYGREFLAGKEKVTLIAPLFLLLRKVIVNYSGTSPPLTDP